MRSDLCCVFSHHDTTMMPSSLFMFSRPYTSTVVWIARRQEAVEDVPCGNTVAMVGLDQFITKNATLTNEKCDDAFPIKAMKFSVSPVVSFHSCSHRKPGLVNLQACTKCSDGQQETSRKHAS